MDLKITAPPPTPEERAAVDALLERMPRSETGGGRDRLLPALHALSDRVGWLSEGGLGHICRRLGLPPAEVYGVATFYHLFSLAPRAPVVVHVCDDILCRIRGGEALCAETGRALPDGAIVHHSPCLGLCERAPAALVIAAGAAPRADGIAPATPELLARVAGGALAPIAAPQVVAPQAGQEGLTLLARVGTADPTSLDAFRASGGGRALARAIELGREGVVRDVIASGLFGRGGAAFPTGKKWEAVAREPAPRLLVCNADESEPGTFKDRVLMEEDPFGLIEGITIAAYASGCERGYIYLRGEYPLAHRRLQQAIDACRAAGLLGGDVAGAGFAFDLELRRGAGAYICGEETALLNSIEGKRGEPRQKPPFPTQHGLFGRPTVINNVETLAAVPPLLLGRSARAKLFCVSGHVTRPGVYEVELGVTLRQLIDLAGGVSGGRGAADLQAVLLGGAAGSFVGPGDLDVPLTLEGVRKIGASLGSGVVAVFDHTVDLADLLARIAQFFRDESCGQCVPCRVGTVRQDEALARLRAARGDRARELALIAELGRVMRDASICGLGQTASSAIESALRKLPVLGGAP